MDGIEERQKYVCFPVFNVEQLSKAHNRVAHIICLFRGEQIAHSKSLSEFDSNKFVITKCRELQSTTISLRPLKVLNSLLCEKELLLNELREKYIERNHLTAWKYLCILKYRTNSFRVRIYATDNHPIIQKSHSHFTSRSVKQEWKKLPYKWHINVEEQSKVKMLRAHWYEEKKTWMYIVTHLNEKSDKESTVSSSFLYDHAQILPIPTFYMCQKQVFSQLEIISAHQCRNFTLKLIDYLSRFFEKIWFKTKNIQRFIKMCFYVDFNKRKTYLKIDQYSWLTAKQHKWKMTKAQYYLENIFVFHFKNICVEWKLSSKMIALMPLQYSYETW